MLFAANQANNTITAYSLAATVLSGLNGEDVYTLNGTLKKFQAPYTEQFCNPGDYCPGGEVALNMLSFARDGSIADAFDFFYSPDTAHAEVDDLAAAASGPSAPLFVAAAYRIDFDYNILAAFAYQPTTNRFALAINYYDNICQVKVGPFEASAPFDHVIGSSNNMTSLLDGKLSSVALGTDDSVYVASSTGYINVYAPGANGDVAPVRRILGSATLLASPAALTIYSP